jgi:DnaJ domain
MPQIGTILLVNLFSALLPPLDPNERNFYEILKVERNASNDDIRKAYKKLSLKLHPDKVAQRGESKREEAAAEYEKVQEAYAVLVNDEKRQKYDLLGSPTRYRFVAQGAIASPSALYDNLSGASFVDKTRLMMFITIIILLILTQPILIAAKINQTLEEQGTLADSSWFAIFSPYWIIGGLVMILSLAITPFVPAGERLPICVSIAEQFLWYLGLIFLCLRWDGTWTSTYGRIFIPIYLAVLLRWTQSVLILRKVRQDVTKMVTVEFLEREVLKGKSLEELEEAELADIRKQFLVITVAPDFVPIAEEGTTLDEAKLEEQKVEASPEFQAATEIYNATLGGLAPSVVFGTIFMILVTRKLDGHIAASWWVVFVPVWIERGTRWILNLHHCVCGTVASDEIVLPMTNQMNGNEGNNDEQKMDNNQTADEDAPKKNNGSSVPRAKSVKQPTTAKANDDMGNNLASSKMGGVCDDKSSSTKDDERVTDEDSKQKNTVVKDARKEKESSPPITDQEAKAAGTGSNGEDNEEYIHLDEETFRAWQSAYEQAEENAMQQQAKASSEWCNITFQLILTCLVVAKIQKNWENSNPEDVGFSVFWILFPFFLFFGFICCCCALLVYGASPGSASDLQEGETNDGEKQDVENPPTAQSTIIPQPPPVDEPPEDNEAEEADALDVKTTCAETEGGDSSNEEKAESHDNPPNKSMDDLD